MIVSINGTNYLFIESTMLVDSTFSFKFFSSRKRAVDGSLLTTSLADSPLIDASLKFFDGSNYFKYLSNNLSKNIRVNTLIEMPLLKFNGNLIKSDFVEIPENQLMYFKLGDIVSIDEQIRYVEAFETTIVTPLFDEYNQPIFEEDGETQKVEISQYVGIKLNEPIISCDNIYKCVTGFIEGDIEYSTNYDHTTFEVSFKSSESFDLGDDTKHPEAFSLSSSTAEQRRVAIAVDCSGSMIGTKINAVKSALESLKRLFSSSSVDVTGLRFNLFSTTTSIYQGTSDFSSITQNAIDGLYASGDTDAIAAFNGLSIFFSNPSDKDLLIILSDGEMQNAESAFNSLGSAKDKIKIIGLGIENLGSIPVFAKEKNSYLIRQNNVLNLSNIIIGAIKKIPKYPFSLIRDNDIFSLSVKQHQIVSESAYAKRISFSNNNKQISQIQITSNIEMGEDSFIFFEFMNLVKGSGQSFLIDIGFEYDHIMEIICDDSFDIIFKSPELFQLALNAEEV